MVDLIENSGLTWTWIAFCALWLLTALVVIVSLASAIQRWHGRHCR